MNDNSGPAGEFQNVTWTCATPGCRDELVERFHLPTDGEPSRALPPKPWTAEVGEAVGRRFFCPACSRARKLDLLDKDVTAIVRYENVDTAQDLAQTWQDEHRCLVCFNADICKLMPQPNGHPYYVAVSRCVAFEYSSELAEEAD